MVKTKDMHNRYYRLGRRVQWVRQKRGITQEQLASSAKVSVTHLGLVETGNRKPSLDLLFRIADYLEVKIEEFFKF